MSNIFVLNHLSFQNEMGNNLDEMDNNLVNNMNNNLDNNMGNNLDEFSKFENMFERFSKIHKVLSENCLGLFNEFIPVPKETENYFTWMKKNWGTRWDAFDVKVNVNNYSVTFTTKDCTPDMFLKTISEMYPEYKMINTVKIIEKDKNDTYQRDLELYTQFIYNGEIRTVCFNHLNLT